MFVVVLNAQVEGMVSLAERRHFTGDLDAYIGEVVVDGTVEGRGAGRALMTAAERWAANRGLPRITLETGTRNQRARRFYANAGYLEIWRRISALPGSSSRAY